MTAPHGQSGQPSEGISTASGHIVAPVLYSVREAAQALRLSRSVMYELISAGQLRSIKQGARRLISIQALDEYVASIEIQSNDVNRTKVRTTRPPGGRM